MNHHDLARTLFNLVQMYDFNCLNITVLLTTTAQFYGRSIRVKQARPVEGVGPDAYVGVE